MRMWMIDPEVMCDSHLKDEHINTHMFVATMAKGASMEEFLDTGMMEPLSLKDRHDTIAAELTKRGLKHTSPMNEIDVSHLGDKQQYTVDVGDSISDLVGTCYKCLALYTIKNGPIPVDACKRGCIGENDEPMAHTPLRPCIKELITA